MSRATKRKHVLNEEYQDYFTPPQPKQKIVRIVASKGNNLHEVESAGQMRFLASMPSKFRKNIWVKRGDFVIVEPIKEGDKVQAEMVRVLSKEHIKYFKKVNVWPEGFDSVESDSDDDASNKNRAASSQSDSKTSSSSETVSSDKGD